LASRGPIAGGRFFWEGPAGFPGRLFGGGGGFGGYRGAGDPPPAFFRPCGKTPEFFLFFLSIFGRGLLGNGGGSVKPPRPPKKKLSIFAGGKGIFLGGFNRGFFFFSLFLFSVGKKKPENFSSGIFPFFFFSSKKKWIGWGPGGLLFFCGGAGKT